MPYAPRYLPTEGTANTANWEQLVVVLNESPGAWANPEGFSAKLEGTATTQVRKEQGATVARLKGIAKANAEIPAKTTLFTLPAGYRPPAEAFVPFVNITAPGLNFLRIMPTGAVSNELGISAAQFIAFDGVTFNLT